MQLFHSEGNSTTVLTFKDWIFLTSLVLFLGVGLPIVAGVIVVGGCTLLRVPLPSNL